VDTAVGAEQIIGVMTLKTLKEMRDAAPFKRFQIHLSDGHALTVATPDHLFFMPNGKEFLVVLPDGGFRFVDGAQVVRTGPMALAPSRIDSASDAVRSIKLVPSSINACFKSAIRARAHRPAH
jgi:hypothetical protein